MIKNRQKATGTMKVAVGEQKVCHEECQVMCNSDELLHCSFLLSKNLYFILTTATLLPLFSAPLSVPRQPPEC